MKGKYDTHPSSEGKQIKEGTNMTTKEVKKMVNKIIDMNDTDTRFVYSPGTTYYQDGFVIVTCTSKERRRY